jgi:hypothetical protein
VSWGGSSEPHLKEHLPALLHFGLKVLFNLDKFVEQCVRGLLACKRKNLLAVNMPRRAHEHGIRSGQQFEVAGGEEASGVGMVSKTPLIGSLSRHPRQGPASGRTKCFRPALALRVNDKQQPPDRFQRLGWSS